MNKTESMDSEFIYSLVLHITAVVAMLNYFNLKNDYYRNFSIYLLIILLLDRYIRYFYRLLTDDQQIMGVYSSYYYNYLVIPFEFLFISWLFFKKLDRFKNLIQVGTFIYLIIWLIEIYNRFGTGHIYFFTYSYQIGSLWMLIIALTYFIDIMQSNRIIDFHKERFFYVSLGIIIFYVFTLPIHVFMEVLKKSEDDLVRNLPNILSFPLNSIMYSLFAASFIWGKRN